MTQDGFFPFKTDLLFRSSQLPPFLVFSMNRLRNYPKSARVKTRIMPHIPNKSPDTRCALVSVE
ncbi:uncharacterized protein BT62DRAFT_934678, partial [Guyanagaster necrorhizus]